MNGSWPRKLDLTYHSRVLHLLVCALFQPPAMHFLRREDKGRSIGQGPHLRPDCTLDLLVGKPIFCKKKKDSRLLEGPRWLELYHTSTFVAIFEIAWSAIVPGTNDTAFSNKDTPHPAFHAVTSLCSKGS